MLNLVFSLLLSSAAGTGFFVEQLAGHSTAAKGFGGIADKGITLKVSDDDADDSADDDQDIDIPVPPQPPVAPTAPTPPIPPIPPIPPKPPPSHFNFAPP